MGWVVIYFHGIHPHVLDKSVDIYTHTYIYTYVLYAFAVRDKNFIKFNNATCFGLRSSSDVDLRDLKPSEIN